MAETPYKFKENVSEATQKFLAEKAHWAVGLLETLTKETSEEGMPFGVLNACEGLAFMASRKGGLGVTIASAHGFVIRKLASDSAGNQKWSAPVFFKESQVGVGLSAGYEHVESALALMNVSTVHSFAASHTLTGVDLGTFGTSSAISGMPAGAFGGGAHLDIAADRETAVFCYSHSSGVLVNVSINGTGTAPESHWNTALYGADADLVALLEGRGAGAETFEALAPLYRTINSMAAKARQ